jgi:hypothetical protein
MRHTSKIQKEFLKFANDLDGNLHKEREKRLTLLELPEEVKTVKPQLIQQGILREVRGEDGKNISYARVRMTKKDDEEPKYSLGVKNLPLQQEVEIEISKEMFESFFPDNVIRPQAKLRYSLPNGWDVDKIVGKDEIYAEYEHEKSENVEVPSDWKVKK